jgi:16S rRNA pseudouridine516 synthase
VSLIKYLGNLGYGSRRDVAAMLAGGRVTRVTGGRIAPDDAWTHDGTLVDGDVLDPPPGAVVVLHKPVGYVCSSKDVPPLIYELLPARFVRRSPVMAPVGRLDRDTSGLLLLTDDGALNHRLTSPRSHLPKTYRATLAQALRGDEAEQFSAGTLRLNGETTPLAPATMLALDSHTVELIITEGRYHQVRRMFAALGNHVVALERRAIGALGVGELPVGEWRLLSETERGLLVSR